MAVFNSIKAASPGHQDDHGDACVFDDKVNVGSALANGDTVNLIRIPAGHRIERLAFPKFDDFDTGAALVFNLGIAKCDPAGVMADDLTRFGTGFTFLRAASAAVGVTEVANFEPFNVDEDVFVALTVTTAQAGGGTGAITTQVLTKAVGVR